MKNNVLRVFNYVLLVVHDILLVVHGVLGRFTMYHNVLQCLVSRATIGITALAIANRLRDRDNATGIGDNAAEIGNNSAEIDEDATGQIGKSTHF